MFELESVIRKNIRALLPYSSARDEFSGQAELFLDANESPFGSLNRYPDPYQCELKNKLATQRNLDEKMIFVGNGSDEVIDLLYRIFCEPKRDKALTFTPTYGMYDVSAGINDVELLKVPLTGDFDIDIETTKALLGAEQIKLTFICSPNNPTGNVFCQQKIETILQTSTGIVVIDEAYIDFSSTKSLVGLIDRYPNLVVLQTMSKARGLAAARVGFAFAARPIIELLNKVKPPYNVSLLNQQAALAALNNETDYCRNLQEILAEKETLYNFLEGLSSVQEVFPSAANFLLVRFNDADLIYQRLIKRKIIVRNRNTLIRNCIRITVGSSTENQLLMNELKQLENEKSIVY